VPEDLLDGRGTGAETDHEGRRRVPEIVKPKAKDLAMRAQLHPAGWAPTLGNVL
jgi:hypothetical protein